MHASHSYTPWLLIFGRRGPSLFIPSRHASLTSAISKGVRKGASALKRAEQHRIREGGLGFWERKDAEKIKLAQDAALKRAERNEVLRHLSAPISPTAPKQGTTTSRDAEFVAKKRGVLLKAPTAIPYTTAASEFLYGTFAVLAALKANRRKIHKLYAWDGEDSAPIDADHKEIIRCAKKYDVPVVRVAGSWDRLLEKMAGGRPHNGYVLETSAIPKLLVTSLSAMKDHTDPFELHYGPMSEEERSTLKMYFSNQGTCVLPKNPARKNRFPLMLWLDRVTDTGNMGAIFRSALYFGVDAILVPQHGTAPFSAVTVKASAGAVERIPILTVKNELDFMQRSQENGWKFMAAGALDSSSERGVPRDVVIPSDTLAESISEFPCVLMLGNEGEGLRPSLSSRADFNVSIKGVSPVHELDSLNVSVAAALLTAQLLSNHHAGQLIGFSRTKKTSDQTQSERVENVSAASI